MAARARGPRASAMLAKMIHAFQSMKLMLRDQSAEPLTPQPGLDDVPMLVEQLSET